MLEKALLCCKLTQLVVSDADTAPRTWQGWQKEGDSLAPPSKADVEQLDIAVAAHAPLLELTSLELSGLYFTRQAICQLLQCCPILTSCTVRGVPRHLPGVLDVAENRRVWLKHGWPHGPVREAVMHWIH